jgi:hypothetical protein
MLADNLRKIASNFSGTPQDFNDVSLSFITFIRERAFQMAVNGHKGMGFSMNYCWWSLDVVKASLPLLNTDGFETRIIPQTTKLQNGEEAIEFIITVEWK